MEPVSSATKSVTLPTLQSLPPREGKELEMKNLIILFSITISALAQSYPPAQGPLPPPAGDNPQMLQIRLVVDNLARSTVEDKLNGPPDPVTGAKSINAQLAARTD